MNSTTIVFAALVAAACCVGLLLSGCAVFKVIRPYDHGYAVGATVYAAYDRIADRQSPEFRAKVAELWASIMAIDTTENLATELSRTVQVFDMVVKTESLSDARREKLQKLKDMVLSKLDGKLSDQALKKADAIEYLKGLRAGIEAMRTVDEE